MQEGKNASLRKSVVNSFFINPVQGSEIEKLIPTKIKVLVHVTFLLKS